MLSQLDFSLAVIDLDNTLYAANNGVFSRMDEKMNTYIQRELQIDTDEADILRIKYWQQYGSTLKGLMLHHDKDAEEFLKEVHDIQAFELLSYQPELSAALDAIVCRKVIHTNGTKEHANTILDALGIRHYFEFIYDIRFNQYAPKPCVSTLEKLFAVEKIKSGGVLVIDDMQNNLSAAKQVGAKTAWIHPEAEQGTHDWDVAATSFVGLLKR